MRIVLIGAGNLATNLGKALFHAGHEIVQVYSRTEASAKILASVLKCTYTDTLEDVTCNADIYIVAVKDSALSDVAESLQKRLVDKLVVHTAGSIPMDVLPFSRKGVFYLQYHHAAPAVAFQGDHTAGWVFDLGHGLQGVVQRVAEQGIDFPLREEIEQRPVDHIGKLHFGGIAQDVLFRQHDVHGGVAALDDGGVFVDGILQLVQVFIKLGFARLGTDGVDLVL